MAYQSGLAAEGLRRIGKRIQGTRAIGTRFSGKPATREKQGTGPVTKLALAVELGIHKEHRHHLANQRFEDIRGGAQVKGGAFGRTCSAR